MSFPRSERRGVYRGSDDSRTGVAVDTLGSVGLLAALLVSIVWSRSAGSRIGPTSLFYLHVTTAWIACLALVVGLVGAAIYLWQARVGYDAVSRSSVEAALGFATASVVIGSAWTRWVRGAWWVWDPSSVAAVVLWLVCFAYLVLRRDVSDPERAARLGAAYVVPALLSVPLTLVTLAWQQGGRFSVDQLAVDRVVPLLVSGLGLLLLYAALLRHRSRLALLAREVARLRAEATEEGLKWADA